MGSFRPGQDGERRDPRFRYARRVSSGHYALLVSDAEFDAAFARIRAQGVRYYADPRRTKPSEINHLHGGRGFYFEDPNGHVMEIITQPYGDRPEQT
jgi:catechol 2,3-dioxygenase-like lactoylglutathione lyase family enzyme